MPTYAVGMNADLPVLPNLLCICLQVDGCRPISLIPLLAFTNADKDLKSTGLSSLCQSTPT